MSPSCFQETVKDGTQKSGVESGNQQRDTTPAEHVTCDKPSTDRENQRETTPSRSSLDPAPAPETTSPSLAQSEPITACPDKPDTKSGLVDSDDMERTLSKNSKDTVSTSQEDEEEEEEEEFEDASEHLEDEAEGASFIKHEPNTRLPVFFTLKETKDPEESVTLSKGISKGEDTPEETVPEEHREPMPTEGLTIGAVTSHSVSLSWRRPTGVKEVLTYVVSYHSSGDQKRHTSTTSTSAVISNLKPAALYSFTVKSHDNKGHQVCAVSITAHTELSVPGKLTVDSTDVTCATLSWSGPHGMERIRHHFLVSFHSSGSEPQRISTASCRTVLSHLRPGTEYTATVSTAMEDGTMSGAISRTFCTKPSPPERIRITCLEATSVTLTWGRPSGMEGVPHTFRVTWYHAGGPSQSITTEENLAVLSKLRPGSNYKFFVCTVLDSNGADSAPVCTTARTNLPPPGEITVHMVTLDSVSLSWAPPEGMEDHPQSFNVSWAVAGGNKKSLKVKNQMSVCVSRLGPGREYRLSVATIGDNRSQSKSVSVTAYTEPSGPGRVKARDVRSRSVTLCWERPVSMEGVSYMIHIIYSCEGEEPRSEIISPETTTAVLSDLRPGMEYTFNITTVLPNNSCSRASTARVCTKTILDELVCELGLEQHLKNKLTLSTVLEIDGETLTDESIQSLKSLPWCFLKRLLMVNVTARSVRCAAKPDTATQSLDSFLDMLDSPQGNSNKVNPLDLLTAVFLCSDGFLQQEMVLKMSMCQFSVPLLLPKGDAQQCTLVLWAMRDIVKKLGSSSLSKSQILNQVLSNPQQYHDTFVHKNMVCGDTPRKISDGLVEISWYLPCGNKNIDIFSEPVAIANLRGDLSDFQTQYSFLCHTSAAVFMFCDDFGTDCNLLGSPHSQACLFLVSNSQSRSFNKDDFRRRVSEFQLQPSNVIMKGPQMNDSEFVNKLRLAITDLLKENLSKISVEQMSVVAHEFGIPVDEDYMSCQHGRQMADAITAKISDIPKYKEKMLPLQGTTWKQLAKLEKEECRLKNAREKNIEMYKSELSEQKQKLREQQRAHHISEPMSCFISAMSGSTEERAYFLKWLRINLDNLSRKKLSSLREKYKKECQISSENKDHIVERSHLSADDAWATQKLCAELLLEGFPLELVDGNASNIPLQWVTQVLKELHRLTQYKIRVVTVLGVQSTGKSTLLNTMFGVQFAVSSGRCTRGAFMLLIRVKEDFKRQLGCDCIMVIDTEGLKSPELAQLDDSYEHDNELATLVVGLSDITVINIAMENSTEMKDILQIVVHAFLRMKEVGRKPCCQFVHQNVPDISAHDTNLRDRKLLLEQLNEMTQAAAKMENRGNNRKFTDVMVYDPDKNNWYVPGLWHGTPPMAPVNAGYSEAVNLFKRSVIEMFKEHKSGKNPPHTFSEFIEWTRSLWVAVKYENFIFSFRNSLVADAYTKLCTEFNKWEWAFRKSMYSWLTQAETKVSNFGTVAAQTQPSFNVADLLSRLRSEATLELDKGEKLILDNLTEYYKRQEGHVHLVERYKEDFVNSAKSVRREMENSVKNKIEAAVEIRKGMFRLEGIKQNHTITMEQKVLKLIERCRESKINLSDQQLGDEFGKMWDETVKELCFSGLDKQDIVQDIYLQLRANLGREGGLVHEMVSNVGKLVECGKEPFKVHSKANIFSKIWTGIFGDEQKVKTQNMASHIIKLCRQFVDEKVRGRSDYHNTYMIDLLRIVDENLDRHRNLETSAHFEASLKIHICGHVARRFSQMHLDFIRANDPRQCLEQFKGQYCADFKDLFYERDQCQKKAEEFTFNCLAPAVREYVTKSLGPDLVDEVLTGKKGIDFSTRSFFQFSILKQLLTDDNFENFMKYVGDYEAFVQDWIFEQMVQQFSKGDGGLRNLEEMHLKVIIKRITEAVVNAQAKDICSNLRKELVIPKDALEAVLALNTAKPEEFSRCLKLSVDEMEESFTAEFHTDVRAKLDMLPFKPQKELFNRVFGCGRQCPFCRAPCEAGGKSHTEHFTSIHRPDGIGRMKHLSSRKLSTDVCSSSVASESRFRKRETEGQFHPYKDYRSIYPDWLIQPDISIQASDYWKYVFVRFNKKFSKEYKAEPADLPSNWKSITKEQAMESLEESFKMKKQ
ncbi:hypothetical protein AAFF_G00303110 [Aldrovandia affinis]|uniref:Interferon-induced very large GTPase 1-like n=1 Tax=Aldrovandia affinis TaxID=143900 RepID=A0AAD7W0U3_9TELE|nr:hypothetical protein AAFF_G00303110 [Aldrovandia affinis]